MVRVFYATIAVYRRAPRLAAAAYCLVPRIENTTAGGPPSQTHIMLHSGVKPLILLDEEGSVCWQVCKPKFIYNGISPRRTP